MALSPRLLVDQLLLGNDALADHRAMDFARFVRIAIARIDAQELVKPIR
ncbi:hypothetical protein [Bradyrhizobium sp. Ash2021]|nr:hypothetical protein [Bradyrhizobium sp. Ash2021]WMT79669.1 hypothetical protein NL528_45480 [Bradyrhizobium sp. Ash2021]